MLKNQIWNLWILYCMCLYNVCINVCVFTSLTTVHLCIRKSVLLTPCSKTRFGNFLMAKSRSLHCSRVLLIFWATLSNIWHCVGVETAANISISKTRVRKSIKKNHCSCQHSVDNYTMTTVWQLAWYTSL